MIVLHFWRHATAFCTCQGQHAVQHHLWQMVPIFERRQQGLIIIDARKGDHDITTASSSHIY